MTVSPSRQLICVGLAIHLLTAHIAPGEEASGSLTADAVRAVLDQQIHAMANRELRWRRLLKRPAVPHLAAKFADERRKLEAMEEPKDKFAKAKHENDIDNARSWEAHWAEPNTEESIWVLRFKSFTDFYGKKYVVEKGRERPSTEYSTDKIRRHEPDVLLNTLGGCGPIAVLHRANIKRAKDPSATWSWAVQAVTPRSCSMVLSRNGKPELQAEFTRPSFLCTRISTFAPFFQNADYLVPEGTPAVKELPFLPTRCTMLVPGEDVWEFVSAASAE
jgi:hypothetical protein